jgi:hypothetical protein
VQWWLLPIHPELRTNFFEKVWPKKDIKRQYKANQFEKNTDDSDGDKKLYAEE